MAINRIPGGKHGERRRDVAAALTEAINEIFWNPRSGISRDDLRERTTVHFLPYAEDMLFTGGRTPKQRGVTDVTVELSDWSMPFACNVASRAI